MKTPRLYRILLWVTPFLVLVAGFIYTYIQILQTCQGHFIYSLDDPYIHLALAESIAQGHYGINLNEPSAPSSSILWPFLLAPFAWVSFFDHIPLVFTFFSAAAALFIYMKIVRVAFEDKPDLFARAAAAWIGILLIPATSLIGLAFTGMEHSLQVAVCAGIVLGLILVVRGQPVPWWLLVLLLVAPAVRYETLALCVPALVVLAVCKRWKAALIGLAAVALPVGLFSLFLQANGLGWLPSSVVAKVGFAAFRPTENFIVDHINFNLELRQGKVLRWMMLALGLLGFARIRANWRESVLAFMGAAAVLAHLAAGQIGWWDRYEVYMLTTAALLVIYLSRGLLWSIFSFGWTRGFWLRFAWVPLCMALVGWLAWLVGKPYFENFERTPIASANIYEQQYQMHRFVVDYLKAPVAVNDLGLVAFRNPNYVLDLWGLASPEALALRTANEGGGPWMEEMVSEREVKVVLIYDDWFGYRPRGWARVARLYLGSEWVVVGSNIVAFYVPDPEDIDEVNALIAQFKTTLPPGVRLDHFVR